MEGFGDLYWKDEQKKKDMPIYSGKWKKGKFNGRGLLKNLHPSDVDENFDKKDLSVAAVESWEDYDG